MGKLKIGIIGCGAIGSSLAGAIARDFQGEAKLTALYDIDTRRSARLSRAVSAKEILAVKGINCLISKSELVIETASSASSWEIAQKVLFRNRDIMIMSVGGVIEHFNQLCALAKKKNRKVYIPSGAISGVDALKAARIAKIKKVVLTTRKNPVSFKGVSYIKEKGIELGNIKKDKVLFSGPARQAVKYFPQNINVAAVLSLAGIGQNRTRVKIIASPATRKNIHEIEIESNAGRVFTRTENLVHPQNPKTSFLAVLSAIAVLKQILNPVRIGT